MVIYLTYSKFCCDIFWEGGNKISSSKLCTSIVKQPLTTFIYTEQHPDMWIYSQNLIASIAIVENLQSLNLDSAQVGDDWP